MTIMEALGGHSGETIAEALGGHSGETIADVIVEKGITPASSNSEEEPGSNSTSPSNSEEEPG